MLTAASGPVLVFARPAAFFLALLLVPVIILYFLRMRFRRKEIGSVFIWRSLGQATSGGEKMKRRSALLLLLQMGAILAATAAAAGPTLVSGGIRKPGVAIVIDVSASMATRDCPIDPRPGAGGETSRAEAAVREAIKEIDGLGEDVPIALFACADTARALLEKPVLDKAAAKAALRPLVAGEAAFDETACADALKAALDGGSGEWSAVVFTDGGLSLNGETLSSAFGGSVRFRVVGSRGDNLGATGLRIETAEEGTRAAFSFWNGGVSPDEVEARLTRDGDLLASEKLIAKPGWSRSAIALDEAAAEGAYTLEVTRIAGGPPARCYLAVAGERNLTALLIGRKNPFITATLAHEGISYTSASAFPDFLSPGGGNEGDLAPDIIISDYAAMPAAVSAAAPAAIPQGVRTGLVVFGAPPPDAPLAASGRVSGRIVAAEGSQAHPLSRFVDWEGAEAESSLHYAVRGEAVVLATIGGKPVVVAWEKDGYRRLACGIDLARSDLGLKTAFPVLLQNYLQWYGPRTDAQSVHTLMVAERARRLEDESFKVRGDSMEVERSGPAVLLTPRAAGIFEWEASGKRGSIAVNVPPSELDVAPRPLVPRSAKRGGTGTDGEALSALAALPVESSRRFDAPVSALFAVFLAAEWILWSGTSKRRPRPKKSRYET